MPVRYKMPRERSGITHKFTINGVKGYLTVGQYEDGGLGEIFVKMDKQGSQVSGFVDAWAIAVSMMLQVGVPLSEIIAKFRGMHFEPSGMTGVPEIRFAQSPIDYVVRWLDMRFVEKEKPNDET